MDWDDLRHFLALAEHGSLSKAAGALKVDHTTIARRIGALEASLGLRLVDRLPRATILTAEGEQIAAAAGPVCDGVAAVLRVARGATSEISGAVIVSAPPALASTILAPQMAGLRARHPGIVVHLIGETRAAALNRREADVAVRLGRPEPEAGMVARKLADMEFALFAAPHHLNSREAADWVFIAYDESLDHVPQQRWLLAVANNRPVVFRANDVLGMATAAAAGIGIAALPRYLGEMTPGLRLVEVAGPPPPSRELWLAVHEDVRRAPRVRAVMDHLVQIITQTPGAFDGALVQPGSRIT